MGLSPISGIHEIARVDAAGKEREVQPPFAIEPGRMDDDAYGTAHEEAETGLEEEEDPGEEEDETSEGASEASSTDSTINLFA